jgi:hypothetical protein
MMRLKLLLSYCDFQQRFEQYFGEESLLEVFAYFELGYKLDLVVLAFGLPIACQAVAWEEHWAFLEVQLVAAEAPWNHLKELRHTE